MLFRYELYADLQALYAPNFEKVGRAYCFRLVCLSVCACVRLLTFEWCMVGI